MSESRSAQSAENLRTLAIITYVLYLLACLNGITALIGVIIAYVKRGDAEGTPYKSHFDNLISVFWTTLIAGILGAILVFVVIGFAVLAGLLVWYLYRTIRGLLRAVDGKAY